VKASVITSVVNSGLGSFMMVLWRRKKILPFHKNQAVNLQQIPVMCKLVTVFFFILCFSSSSYSQSTPLLKDTVPFINIKTVPANYQAQRLSFFCKKEMQIQKTTGLNLFFRLGNKEYVDYLERKPNAVKRD